MNSPDLLIVASPRSGTRFIAQALSSTGASFSVGHETPGRNGMASGLAVVDDYYYLGKAAPKTSTVSWSHFWHQTRHPLSVIPSLAKAMKANFWSWQHRHTGVPGDMEPVLIRSAQFWLNWMERIAALPVSWTYKLEEIESVWPEMLSRLGFPACEIPAVSATTFVSGAHRLEWVELRDLDSQTHDAVRKAAEELGYP